MIRPCPRCHEPLTPNTGILDDAHRAEIILDFVPLRCRHGHTERLELPKPKVRYVPTCGYCGEAVTERKRDGRLGRLNHAACRAAAGGKRQTYQHGVVEMEA